MKKGIVGQSVSGAHAVAEQATTERASRQGRALGAGHVPQDPTKAPASTSCTCTCTCVSLQLSPRRECCAPDTFEPRV